MQLQTGRPLLFQVHLAGFVLAYCTIPAVAIARDPRVKLSRHPANSRNQQNPGQEFPSRQQHSDPRPGIAATEDASMRIDSQHPAHGFFSIHLRKPLLRRWIVQVQKLDALRGVKKLYALCASSAQITTSIKKYGDIGHGTSLGAAWQASAAT
jgi:hypothetical protein